MPLNAFYDGLDNITRAGRFFVALTERLGEGTVVAGEDATRLAHAFGIPIPPELEGSSIETMEDKTVTEQATERRAEPTPLKIVVYYPPVSTPGSGQAEMKFKKCFKVCNKVAGATVCAEVCVDIDIGLKGVHGSITATESVSF